MLKIIIQNLDHFKGNEDIMLSINIDGVPLFKSSGIQLWPILCSVRQFEPFIVAVFCGDANPNSVQEYLSDFLSELTNLQQNGINFNDEIGLLRVTVHAFVCDAPARAVVKCTKSHNAYFSCERCIIKGIYRRGRVVYNIDDNLPALRTEQSFKNFEYKDHQITKSPLVNVGLSCIRSFPLDYMHLVCLGVTKRILVFLKQGPRECKLSHQQFQTLSGKLFSLNGKMPREFAR